MSLRQAFREYLDDPEGPMPQALAEALEGADTTDWVERLLQHVGGAAVAFGLTRSKRRGSNVEGLRVAVGQRIELRLPDRGAVELTLDEVREDGATVVLATTRPWFLRQLDEE